MKTNSDRAKLDEIERRLLLRARTLAAHFESISKAENLGQRCWELLVQLEGANPERWRALQRVAEGRLSSQGQGPSWTELQRPSAKQLSSRFGCGLLMA